jgi:hypothetical protein
MASTVVIAICITILIFPKVDGVVCFVDHGRDGAIHNIAVRIMIVLQARQVTP